MAIRPEETRSADKLVDYLETREGLSASYVAIDKDPPDFRFTVSGPNRAAQDWAVEVTGLAQYVDLEGEERERRLVEVGLHRRVERLDKDYASSLPHSYMLFVDLPLDGNVLRTLEKRVLQYARSGETVLTALDHDEAVASVLRDMGGDADVSDPNVQFALNQLVPERVRVQIKGFRGQKGIGMVSGPKGTDCLPNSNERVGDIGANIEYAVRRILDAKLPKMRTLPRHERKVLLVWSDYTFAKPEEVGQAVTKVYPRDGGLDAVFFIPYGWGDASLVADFTSLM
jgi:hypothetical protein